MVVGQSRIVTRVIEQLLCSTLRVWLEAGEEARDFLRAVVDQAAEMAA